MVFGIQQSHNTGGQSHIWRCPQALFSAFAATTSLDNKTTDRGWNDAKNTDTGNYIMLSDELWLNLLHHNEQISNKKTQP